MKTEGFAGKGKAPQSIHTLMKGVTMNYDQWIAENAKRIERELRDHAQAGRLVNLAVFATPAQFPAWGKLTLAETCPNDATDVVWFPVLGGTTRVTAIPYSSLQGLLWHACRRLPICGDSVA